MDDKSIRHFKSFLDVCEKERKARQLFYDLVNKQSLPGVTTHILRHPFPYLIDINHLDGSQNTKSLNQYEWKQLYHELQGDCGDPCLFSLDANAIEPYVKNKRLEVISIGFINVKVNVVRQRHKDLMMKKFLSGKPIIDDNTKLDNLLEEKHIFAAACLADITAFRENVVFSLDEKLSICNHKLPSHFEIDFDDGKGLVTCHLGDNISVSYNTEGGKQITICAVYSKQRYYSKTTLKAAANLPLADETIELVSTEPYQAYDIQMNKKLIPTDIFTSCSPVMTQFGNNLFMAIVSATGSPGIFVSQTNNGSQWVPNPFQLLNPAVLTSATPAVTQFNGQLVMAIKAADSSNRIYISSSNDGTNWNPNPFSQLSEITIAAPDLTTFNNKLFMAFSAPDHTVKVGFANPGNITNFTFVTISGISNSIHSPSLEVFKNRLYLAVRNNTDATIQVTSSSDGVTWDAPYTIPNVNTSEGPAIATWLNDDANTRMIMAFQSNDPSYRIYWGSTQDGQSWTSFLSTGSDFQTTGKPALARYIFSDTISRINTIYVATKQSDNRVFVSTTSAGYTSGKIHIWRRPGQSQLTKPLLAVPGIGGYNLDLTLGFLYQLNNFSQGKLAAEYDFVVLQYDDITTYIQRNAYLLKQMIIYTNQRVVGGSSLAVIAASMGGPVSEYCFKDMVSKGINTNISKFISADSPLKGANVTLGLQFIMLYFYATGRTQLQVLPFLNGLFQINSRQMLLFNLYPWLNNLQQTITFNLSTDPLRVALLQEMQDFNVPKFPFYAVAMANGSGVGRNQTNLTPGAKIMSWNTTGAAGIFRGEYDATNTTGSFLAKVFVCDNIDYFAYTGTGTLPLDSGCGSKSFADELFKNQINGLVICQGTQVYVDYFAGPTSYIPTFSAIAASPPPGMSMTDFLSANLSQTAYTTPYNRVWYSSGDNMGHVELNNENQQVVMEVLGLAENKKAKSK